jgi:predicted dehydrogenase
MSDIKTVAVIGLGIGRAHLDEGYSKLPDLYKVLVACDLNEDRLKTIADEFGIPRRTTSFDEVLAMDDIDIIDICTPPMVHFSQIVAALGAGKRVIIEKPLVGSLADADKIIAIEAASKGRMMPIFQYRWGNGFQKALRIVKAGVAGKPYVATVETHWRRDADYYDNPWRGRYGSELGGVLLTHAIHAHDMLQQLLGPIESLSAYTATRVNPIEVEDCAAASVRFESGALATLSASLGAAQETSRFRLLFEHVTFESSLEPYSPGNEPWQIIPRSDAAKAAIDEALEGFEPVYARFRGQLVAYHQSIVAGAETPVTMSEARRSLELITALNHAAETGERQSFPIANDHPKYHGWRPANGPVGSQPKED